MDIRHAMRTIRQHGFEPMETPEGIVFNVWACWTDEAVKTMGLDPEDRWFEEPQVIPFYADGLPSRKDVFDALGY